MSTFPAELTGNWEIDVPHSTVGFVAKHAMISKTRGQFTGVRGGAVIDAQNPENSRAWVDIDAASVDTGSDQRDGHLKSADFFDVENHPTISFRSTGVKVEGDEVVLTGDLTIRGVTKSVELETEFDGTAVDAYGNPRAGFSAKTEISRKEFGLTWNVALEAGGVLVSDKVKISLDISAIKA